MRSVGEDLRGGGERKVECKRAFIEGNSGGAFGDGKGERPEIVGDRGREGVSGEQGEKEEEEGGGLGHLEMRTGRTGWGCRDSGEIRDDSWCGNGGQIREKELLG
jgi:hypothetical protein